MKLPGDSPRAAKMLLDQLLELTGWRVAPIVEKEGDKQYCGILIGDEAFFELMSADE
jgi:hypothetical protein